VLDEAVAAFHAVLRRYTLADLVSNREALSAIFFVDRAARPRPTEKRAA
jgi:Rrf2 family nitric oxide-sensitive transcriptional repressor